MTIQTVLRFERRHWRSNPRQRAAPTAVEVDIRVQRVGHPRPRTLDRYWRNIMYHTELDMARRAREIGTTHAL